jgi:hypothetical protein
MSARKSRPKHGTPISTGMSVRDQAAALGVSKTELGRWKALAAIPEAEFERRLAVHRAESSLPSSASMLAMTAPVPARGRVQRATAIYRAMTHAERTEFASQIGGAA